MKGSIRKHIAKDGTSSWRVRVDVTDAQGKRRQPQRTYRTKREAEAGLRQWLWELEHGTAAEPNRQSVGAYLDQWLDQMRHRVRPVTLKSYAWLIRTYVQPDLGALPLQKLTAQRIQAFYAHCLSRGARSGAALSPRTVRFIHSVLHGALADALRLGIVARNVAEAVTPPRPVHQEAHAWEPDEVRRFLDVARADKYWPLWLIALHTGMRLGELLALCWRDLDLDAAVLRVRRGKTGGRLLALNGPSVAALRDHRARQCEERLLLGPVWEDHDLVFPGQDGSPLTAVTVGRHFQALAKQADCPPLTFHGLRHTHATILMLEGVHPKVVSERLGHRNITITLQTYSHVLPRMHTEAADVFAAAISSE